MTLGVLLPLLQATETREELDWAHLPPTWVVFLLIVPLVIAFVVAIYRRERLAGGDSTRWFLVTLRAAVILAVLMFLAQPMLRRVTYQTRDPHLVVLVDDSLSMSIADKYSNREIPARIAEILDTSPEVVEQMSRYELLSKVLSSGATEEGTESKTLLGRLCDSMRISLYSFAGSVRKIAEIPRTGSAADGAVAQGDVLTELPSLETVKGDERVKQTKVGDAVLEALLDVSGGVGGEEGLVGVLLLTDGQNNAGALQPEEMAYKLRQRGIPLLIVGVGNPDAPKNIRAVDLTVDDVVLVDDEVQFDASVVADGFEGQSVQVDLVFDGEIVDTQYVTLEGGGEKQTVRLNHEPKRPGDYTASVQIEKLGGELFWDDNILSRPVKVLDEKIKVLYVEGAPRWEYRYLKNALVRDATMEAHILLLSADREFRQDASKGLTPLVAFPAEEKELFQYHVIIIGDVDPHMTDSSNRPFRDHLLLIQKFVGDHGGGVVFVAGPEANPHKYLHTELYPLLPVEISASSADTASRFPIRPEDFFSVKLTGAGKEQAMMRLDSEESRNLQLWENNDGIVENHLPSFGWFADVKSVKLAGIALAVHPRLSHPVHGPRVIMATQNYGKGPVFYSGVDNTWRWRAGVGNVYFYRFWGQVARFASTGRLRGKTIRYSVATDRRVYTIGERVAIDAKVYDANMEPSTEPTITAYHSVKGRDLETPKRIELNLNAAREAGAYDGSITAGQLGSHDLWIGTESDRLAFVTFTVEVPPLEYRDPRSDRKRMEKIARLAEGKYYDLHDLTTAVDSLSTSARPRQIPIEERHDDLWDEYWVLLAFTGLITSEWVLRKVVKLL